MWHTYNGIVPDGFIQLFGGAGPAAIRMAQSAALFPVIFLALSAFLYMINRSRGFLGLFRDKKILIITVCLYIGVVGISWMKPAQKFFEVIPNDLRSWGRALLFLIPALLIQRIVVFFINKRRV